MSDTTMDPKAIAQAVAIEVADEDGQVGDFVEAIDLGDNVTDFRFETCIRGYEGWQWSVTLYRDAELDHWTVNEPSLVPTDKALRPPEWIPWKDRLEPTDLAVTDSIGTDPDDPRMEEGFRRTEPVESAESVSDDFQIKSHAFHISAAKGLIAASRYARHLVVGSRGLSGLDAHFLGSVSKQIVNFADCTVTVVH